ncbi:MAG: EAL domain-containing protein, partial [Chloroflexia bacterium]|nr:EAL domain-containing protein [Chloroflexia bacterium]
MAPYGPAPPEPPPYPAWLVALSAHTPDSLRPLLPPQSLLDRVRWIVLAIGLAVLAAALPLLATGSASSPVRLLALTGLGWLVWSWTRRFRTSQIPWAIDIADAAGLMLIGLGAGASDALGVVIFAVFGRALYGGAGRVVVITGLAIAAHLMADAIDRDVNILHDEGIQLVGAPIAAIMAYNLSRVLAGHERSADQLRTTEMRYRLLVEQIPAVTYVQRRSDHEHEPGTLLYISPQISTILGYSPAEWAANYGRYEDRVHPDDREMVMAEDTRTDLSGEPFCLEYRYRAKDGRYVWLRDEAILMPGEPGEPALWQGLLFDIGDRKEAERRLTVQAQHDALTGLPNRFRFLERLTQALDEAESAGRFVAVLFLDLDNFKDVNDSFGHEAGDRLLVAVAERLAARSGPWEMAARLGGDEFTVLLDRVSAPSDAVAAAERFLEPLRAPFGLAGQKIFVRASIGVAVASPGQERPEDLLRQADVALYSAKRQGKSNVRLYDPSVQTHALERLRLETQLTHAIERAEFRLHFQPIVALGTGHVAGLEALIRWQHPVRGLLDPSDFITVAEETGQIVPIGNWVLAAACHKATGHRLTLPGSSGTAPLPISVNLCARQLIQPGVVADIEAVLVETGFPPERLTLEITESVSLEHSHATSETLAALRALGVRLAIDDFGTGHSGLNVLRRRPIQSLKIDRSLVEGLLHNPDDRAIVQAIVIFAQTLGLQTVAEGIETPDQLALLRSLGCD